MDPTVSLMNMVRKKKMVDLEGIEVVGSESGGFGPYQRN
ncbi:hypothetical protein AALP_AAs74016U000300 [Arabis alpina]|uniref:Uncharacterized protein n=1 Tax=Arabis alpina TaxID=50452 RepID=A0A087FY91_ARAAL|nr:hypothetical protein AALP_AAs74016U000300 [Arabis alpina]